MSDYLQPHFYRFSEDSIQLAQFALENLRQSPPRNILDIGAGCGVVGIELIRQGELRSSLTALEYQEGFFESLNHNLDVFLEDTDYQVIHSQIGKFNPNIKFDCIVCNPPYFAANTGRVSPDGEKQICRTLEIESIETFLKKIVELKSPKGKAFLTFPNQDAKRKDILLTYGFEEKREHASVSLFSLT